MNDPYLNDYDAYLNNLDRFSAPERTHPDSFDRGRRFAIPLRAVTILGVVFTAIAFIPWSVSG